MEDRIKELEGLLELNRKALNQKNDQIARMQYKLNKTKKRCKHSIKHCQCCNWYICELNGKFYDQDECDEECNNFEKKV